jgi:hypothetical protein
MKINFLFGCFVNQHLQYNREEVESFHAPCLSYAIAEPMNYLLYQRFTKHFLSAFCLHPSAAEIPSTIAFRIFLQPHNRFLSVMRSLIKTPLEKQD